MRKTRLAILGLLTAAFVGQAQELKLQKVNADPTERAAAIEEKQSEQSGGQSQFSPENVPGTPIAEYITGDIQQLARDLENDPVRIFNYVHDHIRHVMYFGSKKGAGLTLSERSGKEFDQCALLVAMLRAASYTNCGYQFGWMELPYDRCRELRHQFERSRVARHSGRIHNQPVELHSEQLTKCEHRANPERLANRAFEELGVEHKPPLHNL